MSTIESRLAKVEDKVQALETNNALALQRFDGIDTRLDGIREDFKTGWTNNSSAFKEQIDRLREDRKAELERDAEERKALREESRWWWTKAFGILTTVLGIVGAVGTGTYYSMGQSAPEPATIIVPTESAP
ncbi:MAG: hypothetical protein KAI25_05315 [Hyphomicrobiaceae bacterium]|nr:hypothetical protein [Hyphomicrobiaceae bacterium]